MGNATKCYCSYNRKSDARVMQTWEQYAPFKEWDPPTKLNVTIVRKMTV